MENILLVLLGIIAVFWAITYIMHRIFKKNRYVKYMPSIIALILGVYNIITASAAGGGMEDLAHIVVAMMLIAGFFFGLSAALMLDFTLPWWKSRREEKKR